MTDEIIAQAFIAHPGAILFGIAAVILCFYVGLGILFNGWPECRRRK